MRATIPLLQMHERFAFYWRQDGPVCELYAADVAALRSVRPPDIAAAGLFVDGTVHAVAIEAALIEREESRRRPRPPIDSECPMLAIDAVTGRVLARWVACSPWTDVLARLRGVA